MESASRDSSSAPSGVSVARRPETATRASAVLATSPEEAAAEGGEEELAIENLVSTPQGASRPPRSLALPEAGRSSKASARSPRSDAATRVVSFSTTL